MTVSTLTFELSSCTNFGKGIRTSESARLEIASKVAGDLSDQHISLHARNNIRRKRMYSEIEIRSSGLYGHYKSASDE